MTAVNVTGALMMIGSAVARIWLGLPLLISLPMIFAGAALQIAAAVDTNRRIARLREEGRWPPPRRGR